MYERSDANERKKEGLPKVKDFIGAPFDTDVEITENGVHYQVDVVNGQKTGFFLDQKYNRQAIAKIAKGKHVLDCFTHTGAFALKNAELNIDDRTPMEQAAENVVAKRPSVLGKLKAPSVHGAGEKKKSHEQEAR